MSGGNSTHWHFPCLCLYLVPVDLRIRLASRYHPSIPSIVHRPHLYRCSLVPLCVVWLVLSFKMPSADSQPRTLYDKVFQDHIVNEQPDGTVLLYIGPYIPFHVLFPIEIFILTAMFNVQIDISSTK